MDDQVLKVDLAEKTRIEQWTLKNTFPDVIVFVEDADGNFIVGQEVLNDPAYAKLGVIDGVKEQPVKEYIDQKAVRIIYRPKPVVDETKEEMPTSKINSLGRAISSLTERITIKDSSTKQSIFKRIWLWVVNKIKQLLK